MSKETKREFLTVQDYGTGGIWMLINARSSGEVSDKWPDFLVFEDKPDWMLDAEKERYCNKIREAGFVWDIDEKPTGWLRIYGESV